MTRIPRAFTLVELVVVVAIIALLAAITLVGVHSAREAARRVQCASNLHQLSLAIAHYESARREFPRADYGAAASYLIVLLPYLEQNNLYDKFDLSRLPNDEHNLNLLPFRPDFFACPSDGNSINWSSNTNYVANFGTHYFIKPNSGIVTNPIVTTSQVTDGLSKTGLLSEAGVHIPQKDPPFDVGRVRRVPRRFVTPAQLPELEAAAWVAPATSFDDTLGNGWNSGGLGHTCYNHFFTPNTRSARFGGQFDTMIATVSSHHPGGVNFVTADDSCRFVSNSIDRQLWISLGDRSDGEPVSY